MAEEEIERLEDVQAGDMVAWRVEDAQWVFESPAYTEEALPGWLMIAGLVLRRPDGIPGSVIQFAGATRGGKTHG